MQAAKKRGLAKRRYGEWSEADSNLRENQTLTRNLHTRVISTGYGTADEPEVRDVCDGLLAPRSLVSVANCEQTTWITLLPSGIPRRAGLVDEDRHLSRLAETVNINVGGSLWNDKMSSPSMSGASVGVAIVVW